MNLYIAGPMSGHPLFNFPVFFRAALDLRGAGYQVVNPAEIDMANGLDPSDTLESQGFSYEKLIAEDLALITGCNGIALLCGWAESPGTLREMAFADTIGLKSWPISKWLQDAKDMEKWGMKT